ncbi:hypothetical protein MKX07_005615 [Trichoderma sp. CBMAI-0711]|uniref:DUF726 domain protein n=1 Tax=Trichoderma parareesei TaxID=858221 RepID=A0A2H3A440_TRIPA|nr:hypothetical protein MKX07_005615 [Trichoderma sp. CBMAI-0711]OTA06771.1 hypothetical protein A9Z42_0075370 [Trichoderma parareesei]
MARGRGGSSHGQRRPVDLTGIISIAEKNDLLTLINAITERMARDISNVFDSPPVVPIQGDHGHHHWLMIPLLHHRQNRSTSQSHSLIGLKHPNLSKSFEKTREIIEKEEQEAMTPQLRELKKEALVFFRKWQSTVLQRIRDIAVNEQQTPQGSTRGRGRGMRGAPRGRGGGGRGGGMTRSPLTLATGPPRAPSNYVDRDLAARYPPIPNTLWSLDLDKRKLLLHIVFLVLLSMQEYTANSRQLLVSLTTSLNLPPRIYRDEELRLAQGLAKAAIDLSSEVAVSQKSEESKSSRRWKVGLGCGTGNLAAPLSGVGIGTAHEGLGLTPYAAAGLLGSMAENATQMGALFGIIASKPTAKMMEAFTREIQDFGFIPIHGLDGSEYRDAREFPAEHRRLSLTIALSGFLLEDEEITKSWRCLGRHSESYVTRWEVAALTNLGSSLETAIKSSAWKEGKAEIEARTIFSCLIESTWPVALLKISKIIDNTWIVGMVRAEKAGAVLADAIMRQKFQGDRPVSLIGYSLGARAIYTCLMVLAERRQFGIIDSVIMMGTPAPSESRVWLTLKSVVCGRLINVYSEQDYILGFLYRTSNTHFGVAGLQEIQGADGVENYRVRSLPRGHLSYQSQVGVVLKNVGWEDVNRDFVRAAK